MSPSPVLRGELGLIGLFDLGQLLMLNGATGCLVVEDQGRRACLYFDGGRLVNAVDEELREGESAAYRVFAWRTGRYEFRPEPLAGNATIHSTTDAVMLEAARRMDESQSGPAAPPESTRLRERQSELEMLRDAFNHAAGEGVLALEHAAPEAWLESLDQPGDRLVLGAGSKPLWRRGYRWIELDTAPLSLAAYRELRGSLLERCLPIEPGDPTPRSRRLTLPDGRLLAVEIVGAGAEELLWLRPAELAPTDLAHLEGDLDALNELLRTAPGLVLVGGPDLDACRELFHAVLSNMALEDTTTLLASGDPTYRRPESGVVLRVVPEELGTALRTIEPDVVALDPAVTAGEVTLEDLQAVPRVLAGVVGPDALSLLPRWLLRVAGPALRTARARLADVALGLVMAERSPESDTLACYSVYALSAAERAALLGGDPRSSGPRERPKRRRGASRRIG
jgi:hypothetical protein